MAAGDFSKSTLGAVMIEMDRIWSKDGVVNTLYQADCEAAKVLLKEQTANVQKLEDNKDYDVKVWWIKPSIPAVTDDNGTTECVIGGEEKETVNQSYSLTQKKVTGFSVKEYSQRSNLVTQAELIANGFLTCMKALDEAITKSAIAKLEAFKGVNLFKSGIGDVQTKETYIAPANWNENIFSYFNRCKMWNRFNDPFLLHGSNLAEFNFNAIYERLNADQKDRFAKSRTIRQYWDELNIDTINSPLLKSYMVNRGSIAFAAQSYYRGGMVEYVHGANQKRFSIESNNLPGVYYDVFYNNECKDNDIKHNWSFRAKYDFLLNPTGLSETHTGVLSFINGTKP